MSGLLFSVRFYIQLNPDFFYFAFFYNIGFADLIIHLHTHVCSYGGLRTHHNRSGGMF